MIEKFEARFLWADGQTPMTLREAVTACLDFLEMLRDHNTKFFSNWFSRSFYPIEFNYTSVRRRLFPRAMEEENYNNDSYWINVYGLGTKIHNCGIHIMMRYGRKEPFDPKNESKEECGIEFTGPIFDYYQNHMEQFVKLLQAIGNYWKAEQFWVFHYEENIAWPVSDKELMTFVQTNLDTFEEKKKKRDERYVKEIEKKNREHAAGLVKDLVGSAALLCKKNGRKSMTWVCCDQGPYEPFFSQLLKQEMDKHFPNITLIFQERKR